MIKTRISTLVRLAIIKKQNKTKTACSTRLAKVLWGDRESHHTAGGG